MKNLKSVLVTAACCALVGLAISALRAEENATTAAATQKAKLVIKKAFYGDLPDGAKLDVTKKVAEMVKDDALSVAATNENFTDPCEGTVKKLQVDYTFDGKEKSKSVNENDTLTISNTGE